MKKVILGLALCFYCGHYGYGVDTAPLQQAKCKDFLDTCSHEWQQQFLDTIIKPYSTLGGGGCFWYADNGINDVCEYYRFYSVLSAVKLLHTTCEEGKITDTDYEEIVKDILDYIRTHSFHIANDAENDKLEIAGSMLYTTLTLPKEEFCTITHTVLEIVEFIMQIDKTAYAALDCYLLRHGASRLCLEDHWFMDSWDEATWEREFWAKPEGVSEEKLAATRAAFDENTQRIADLLEPRLWVLQRLSQKREENAKSIDLSARRSLLQTYRDF
jgi:hypothetical protein